MKKKTLTKKQIESFCKKHEGWRTTPKHNLLYKTFPMDEYINGLMFIARVTVFAEMSSHHPDIEFSYGKVKVKLTTHDAKGVTELDTALAENIDQITIT